ncbi:MAG: hypothetical protein AAFV77_09360 [Planctomycetota bacterium]
MNTTKIALPLLAACGLALTGCSESTETGSSSTGTAPTSMEWKLASMPEGAVNVTDAKASATEGDTVTVRGIIGGRVDALSAETATFVMVDVALENPCISDDDHCSTPWDYCCSPSEDIQASSATVLLVDAEGKAMAFDLATQGVSPLDEVVVVGTVAARPSEHVLTIRATGLHRVSP